MGVGDGIAVAAATCSPVDNPEVPSPSWPSSASSTTICRRVSRLLIKSSTRAFTAQTTDSLGDAKARPCNIPRSLPDASDLRIILLWGGGCDGESAYKCTEWGSRNVPGQIQNTSLSGLPFGLTMRQQEANRGRMEARIQNCPCEAVVKRHKRAQALKC